MSEPTHHEVTILNTVLQLGPDQRAAYLDKLCAGDPERRHQVETLLQAHGLAKGFMESPIMFVDFNSPGAGATPPDKCAGDRIGRYKLLQQLGEGGGGVVYLAEQEEPVRRRVALKIIKLGMNTQNVIQRFEAERQALAMMDHPYIAKVLDAGATPTGRPYFVMDLVRGVRITDYCDQHHLSTPARLNLFLQICRAIQHAHQKGIIHRDIKPSNILITLQDGVPVPKIIDFGIAKATNDQQLTSNDPVTSHEQFLGTPAYMSPEQASLGGLDIDTRSDIYSLGVLLYELLTGQTPFAVEELLAGGPDVMRRMVREQDPPKPSTRLRTMGMADTADVTRRFRVTPEKLAGVVRGDLDWIVMKALEKDRTRRYESANGLAMDIQRHLADEPVVARPPSVPYRLQKLFRRNKIAVTAAAAVAAALVIGLGLSTWLFFQEKANLERAVEAERQAKLAAGKSQTVARFLKAMLETLNPALAQGRQSPYLHEILDKTAARVATDLRSEPEIQAELQTILGNAYYELEDFLTADKMYRAALHVRRVRFGETNQWVAASLNDLGNALNMEEQKYEAESHQRRALDMRRTLFGPEHPEVANSLTGLADTLTDLRRLKEAEAYQLEALAMQQKSPDTAPAALLVSLNNLGRIYRLGGDLTNAALVFRKALGLGMDKEQNPAFGDSLLKLAGVLRELGQLEEAETLCREALERSRKLLGNEHPQVNYSFTDLAVLLQRQGKLAELEELYRGRLQSTQKKLPVGDEESIRTLTEFSRILVAEEKFAEAEPLTREALTLLENSMPEDWRTFSARSLVGDTLLGQKKYAPAEALLVAGYAGMKEREASIDELCRPYLKEAMQRLVRLYQATGRPELVANLQRELNEFDDPKPANPAAVEPKPQ